MKDYQLLKELSSPLQSYGVEVGIYTSASDWGQITNNTSALVETPKLWFVFRTHSRFFTFLWIIAGISANSSRYYNVKKSGPMGESPMDFVDFNNFGPWAAPIVKQFGQQVSVCGMMVNR